MKSIANYGLFATALATAAFLGHTFTERGYNLKAEQLAVQTKDISELSESSPSDSPVTDNNSFAAAENINAEQSSEINPGSIATSSGKSKSSQQIAKKPIVRRPELSSAEQEKKKLSTSSDPQPVFNEATSTSTASAEMAAGSDRVDTLPESIPDKRPARGLDMLAILAPLLKLTDGKPLGAEAIENKALLVAVWASWCSSCQRQLQALDELEKKLNHPSLQIIVLAADEDSEAIRRVIERRPIHHSIVILDKNASEQLQLQGLPSLYIADAQGRLRSRFNGYGSEEVATFERQIVALLAEIKIDPEKPAMISKLVETEGGWN